MMVHLVRRRIPCVRCHQDSLVVALQWMVCCADGDHCCPSGYKCDLSVKQCLKYEEQTVVAKEMLHVAPTEAELGAEAVHEVKKGPDRAYGSTHSRAGLSTFEALGKSNLSGPHTNHHIVASQHAHTVLYCVCKQAWSLNYSYCVHTAVSAAYSILSL